ncbi:GlxA family transcriptional regulator [Streptomyces yaizuensis]|uniref:Helix-turn-helix domain-containing protein n=1 Tax=Streptomyces yaizuensis TaxID=2989713 RepID=A0ABQ5PAE2_9ACTN|nr:helix-turn-helix domain-containing protein [Streptomyces sp. YSPA8]GLF99553.1 helix-turn-helix domain-containing protein [Streptomyces sp. YSPA8]
MAVIALLVLDGVPGPQLTTPGLLLGAVPHACREEAPYELRICAGPGFRTTAEPGPFGLTTRWGLEGLDGAETVVVAGYRGFRDELPAAVPGALRAAAGRGCRVGAVGTGTFALAATGLLDGRRATTDRRYSGELAVRHPGVGMVAPGAEVVADGPFLTSAGVLGGKDLWMRLIEEEHGKAVAREADRRLFLRLPESGGLPGIADTDSEGEGGCGPTVRWMAENLHRPLTLADIAARAGTSVRTLNRRFRSETGLSPLQYLLRVRIEQAQHLLERGDLPVEHIAARTGLGTPANLRHHFQRLNGTTPGVYRAAFRSAVDMFTQDDREDRGDGDGGGGGGGGSGGSGGSGS